MGSFCWWDTLFQKEVSHCTGSPAVTAGKQLSERGHKQPTQYGLLVIYLVLENPRVSL